MVQCFSYLGGNILKLRGFTLWKVDGYDSGHGYL